jgi:hypothetical protein
MLTALAHGNEDRGGQSWGIHDVSGGVVHKAVGSIRNAPLAVLAGVGRLYGHTRYATHGSVSRDNAHPFVMSGVTGAHNGVVYNHGSLNAAYRRDYPVDSMHILAHIDEGLALDDIESYGALVFVRHDEPDTMYLGRWSAGQLAVYETPHGVVWSSEAGVALGALRGAGIPHKQVDIDEGVLYAVRDGRIERVQDAFFTCTRKAHKGTWQTLGAARTTTVGKPYQGRRDEYDFDNYGDLLGRSDSALARWERGPAADDDNAEADAEIEWAKVAIRDVCIDHGMDPEYADMCIDDPRFNPWDASDPLYDAEDGTVGFDEVLWAKVTSDLDPEVWGECPDDDAEAEARRYLLGNG